MCPWFVIWSSVDCNKPLCSGMSKNEDVARQRTGVHMGYTKCQCPTMKKGKKDSNRFISYKCKSVIFVDEVCMVNKGKYIGSRESVWSVGAEISIHLSQ